MVPLPATATAISRDGSRNALSGLLSAIRGQVPAAPRGLAMGNFLVSLLPALVIVATLAVTWHYTTLPEAVQSTEGLVSMGGTTNATDSQTEKSDLEAPPAESAQEPQGEGVQEPQAEGVQEPPKVAGDAAQQARDAAAAKTAAAEKAAAATAAAKAAASKAKAPPAAAPDRLPTPLWLSVLIGVTLVVTAGFYYIFNLVRLEIFKMLLGSFFPLAVLILAVLGTIVFGWATPTEAAAIGSLGGFLLAIAYRFHNRWKSMDAGAPARVSASLASSMRDLGPILKESSFLTAKTSAMVCWLFVGSSIFSAAFALLGGQELIEKWVLSLNMTPLQFMILSQIIIFLLGWPLEWTEIIVIFMPIFIPLLPHFGIDPLFFGLLVALNLQTAFLSPPVAMAAFYLKGVSPPHVTLNQIFVGMMPFMVIQVIAVILLYVFPGIGLWLPQTLYK